MPQNQSHLFEGRRTELLDPLAHDRGVQLAGLDAFVQRNVHSSVQQQPPILRQSFAGGQCSQALGVGPRQQNDRFRQLGLRREIQLVAIDDLEQPLGPDDIRFAVRNLEPDSADLAIVLDQAAQDARRRQQSGRIYRVQRRFQLGNG